MSEGHERIRIVREQSGLSQEEFGKRMGVTITTQNNYEKGLRHPTLKYLLQLEEEGFDTYFILTGTHNINKTDPLENELLNLWRSSSTEIRFAALNVLATGQTTQTINRIGNITGSTIKGGIHQYSHPQKETP